MIQGRALFVADWMDAVFIHFAVDAERLQRAVPLELDRHDGRAFVSVVAFTQRNLRPRLGGRLTGLLTAPLASHEFLNVRIYVRHGARRGIFFMAEWIPNRLAALIGPQMYGLPYRLGRLRYDGFHREVTAGGRKLTYDARPTHDSHDALDDFLLERYSAFTHRRGVTRRFDVSHAPWPQRRVEVDLLDTTLLPLSGDWHRDAILLAAHHSPGVRDVTISAPRRVLTDRPAPQSRA